MKRARRFIEVLLLVLILVLPIGTGISSFIGKVLFTEIIVVATCYQAVKGQCDNTPLITADGSRINPTNPIKHRWIAVSRDIIKRGSKFGDTVIVTGTPYDGKWIIRDVMNKRFKNKIDFLIGKKDKGGKWEKVRLQIKQR